MDINITPALQIEERKNLSAEEFQKQLCAWLESRGILCELRAYFRSNMIEVLRNTHLGSSISCNLKQPITPKMQGINLLIAEYFMTAQYHFSLCVFCTEVSLNKMLPDLRNPAMQGTSQQTNFKFSEKEVYDILESVGILRHNKQAQNIYKAYSELNEPLLMFFLPSTSVTSLLAYEPVELLDNVIDNDFEFAVNNIEKILTNSNMNPNEISQIQYYIRWLCDKQNEKIMKRIENLKEQYREQLKKYKYKLHNIQKVFESERKSFQEEVDLVKQQLNDFIQKQSKNKSDHYISVNKMTEQLQQTEINIEQISTDTRVKLIDKSTQWVEEMPAQVFKLDEEQQTFTNTSLEAAVLRHVVEQLEKENSTLKSDNYNYCEQIEELANRAAILMNELNISQQNVVRLNSLLQNPTSSFGTGNPPRKQQILHFTGAGEECVGGHGQLTTGSYRNLYRGRKLSTKKLTSGSNSESESTTDELLQEAKKRLKKLEQESDHIDRKIFNFTSGQNERERATERAFNFSTSDSRVGEGKSIFEFGSQNGATAHEKNSRPGTEITSFTGSQTTLTTSASTSYSQLDAEPPCNNTSRTNKD